MTHEEFINRINTKFNNEIECLDTFVSYRKSTNMRFKCKRNELHDEIFTLSAQQVLRTKGKGCPFCNKQSLNNSMVKDFINETSNGKVKLKTKWIYNKTTVFDQLDLVCSIHGEFKECYNNLRYTKNICPKCAYKNSNDKKKQKTIEKIEKILLESNTNLSFDKATYKSVNKNATFICKKHGKFERCPGKILYEKRLTCPKCGMSNGELFIFNILKELGFKENVNLTLQKTFDDLKDKTYLRFDFFLENENIAIEFDGKQHYDVNSFYYDPIIIEHDKLKNDYCKKNNITLIRIKSSKENVLYEKKEKLRKKLIKILESKGSTTIMYSQEEVEK